jgi:hypothetical protein
MRQVAPVDYRDLAALAEGEVTASEAAQLEEALAASPESRRRLDRVRAVTAHLGDTTAVDGIDLFPVLKQRLAAGNPAVRAPRRRWLSPRGLGFALAAAAVALPLVLLKSWHTASRPEQAYRAKSATSHHDARSRWIALNAFRLSGEAAPEPLGDVLHRNDGLLFSYTNLGPTPFSHLMIFGIDEQRRVYWYYPAFMDARDNPKGIDIQQGGGRVGLSEVIAHPYHEGRLTILGLFSDQALSVADVESAVQRGLVESAELEGAFEGVRIKTLQVSVIP